MRKYITYYINSRHNTVTKEHKTIEEQIAFAKVLDDRIKRKTCFGYDLVSNPINK